MNRIIMLILISLFPSVGFSQNGITVKDGKVGIGTITPTTDLELNGTLKVKDTIVGVNHPVISNGYGSLQLRNNALLLFPSEDLLLGQLNFFLGNGVNGLMRLEGRSQYLFAGDTLGMQIGTAPFTDPNNVWMEVGDQGTFVRNKLAIDGDVGIGETLETEARLDINGGTSGASSVLIDNARYYGAENTAGQNIRMLGVSVSNDVFVGAVDNAGGKVYIREDGQNRITINDGDIGIGTTTPQSKMHIRNTNDGGDIYSGLRINPAKAPAEVTRNSHNYHRISGFRREGLWLGGSTDGNIYTRSNILFKDEGILVGMSDGFVDPEQNPKLYISNEGNIGIGTNNVSSSGNNILTFASGTAPLSSPASAVQIYAEDVGSSAELKVRDEAGNITTISPHNFSLIENPSHEMAWSYYSEKDGMAINVDMFRVVQLLEEISGEKLIHMSRIDKEPEKKTE